MPRKGDHPVPYFCQRCGGSVVNAAAGMRMARIPTQSTNFSRWWNMKHVKKASDLRAGEMLYGLTVEAVTPRKNSDGATVYEVAYVREDGRTGMVIFEPDVEVVVEDRDLMKLVCELQALGTLPLGEVLVEAYSDYPDPLEKLRKAGVREIRAELCRKRLQRAHEQLGRKA